MTSLSKEAAVVERPSRPPDLVLDGMNQYWWAEMIHSNGSKLKIVKGIVLFAHEPDSQANDMREGRAIDAAYQVWLLREMLKDE